MNRLILIGNGFDLAHGLRTTYRDFIITYIKSCFTRTDFYHPYIDPLISISKGWDILRNEEHVINEWINDLITSVENSNNRAVEFGWEDEDNTYFQLRPYKIIIRPGLLKVLISRCSKSNWVDIESEYYMLLKDILNSNQRETKQARLKELNDSLAFIISKLEKYLSELKPPPYLKGYEAIIGSMISADELYPKHTDKVITPLQTFVLNFNYTDTPKRYIDRIENASSMPPILNYIHGKLKDADNEIIFGFGDEIDAAYQVMEDDVSVKGYFDYIKSFWYLRNDNYRSLVNFLDSDDYQVYVLGHSLGLSDRTMLQMIFQHEKCRSIKIYYYEYEGGDNFVSLTHEIAKHFIDKGMMRKRIVSKKQSERMPQHDDKPE